jgi:glycosyltransferase involved in cell wall biosynthesis
MGGPAMEETRHPRSAAPRVVLTCNYSPWSQYSGGGQRSTHNLATALARAGRDVTVVFTRAPWEEVNAPSDLAYTLRWAGLVNVRGSSPGLMRLTSVPTIAARIAELARGGHPLVVHSQGEEAALLPELRRVVPRFGLIVTPRYPSFPDTLLHWRDSSSWQRLRLALGDTKYLALGHALRGADFCSPPSAFGGRLIQDAFDLPDERVAPVHNGVPAEFLEHHWRVPADLDELRRRPLVFFGRFSHDKGIDVVIDAAARIPDLEVLLVGRGDHQPIFARQIEERGIAGRVRFHGWADHHTLGALLAEASMAVLPSQHENLSLAMLSALAVGTPLVTTPVGGTPEIMTDGTHGLLVPPDDVDALVRAIERLRADLDFARTLALTGKQHVRENYTWAHTAQRFEALYERACAGRG